MSREPGVLFVGAWSALRSSIISWRLSLECSVLYLHVAICPIIHSSFSSFALGCGHKPYQLLYALGCGHELSCIEPLVVG